MSRRRKQEAPEIAFRAASVRSSSFDEAEQTVEVVWSTGAAVRRYDWWNERPYDEVLDMSPKAVRLDRMNGGAPFLDSHRSGTIANVIGSVVPGTARIENGKGVCRVQLSRADGDADTVQKIRDGVIRNISVGYKVHKIEKTRAETKNEVDEWRIVDWEPLEISAVPIPADPKATIRSSQMPNHEEENETVTKPQKRAPRAMSEIEIRAFAQQVKLPDRWVEDQLEANVSRSEMHRAAVDYMAEQQRQQPQIQPVTAARATVSGGGADYSNPNFRAKAMGEAIACRADPALTPSEPARQFMSMSLVEIAREQLRFAGVDVRSMSRGQVIEQAFATRSSGMHTTSDFGLVLSSAVGRVLRDAYSAVPSGLKALGRRVEIDDFRARTMIALSGLSGLERVNEHGEYKRATLEESGESVKLETFGKIFSISRQAIINDDLNAFGTIPRRFGIEAANFEAEQLANLLMANKLMSDGKSLFHADHSNLATTGAAPSEATLSSGRKAMRLQKDAAGKLIGVAPRALVVGAELETESEKLMAQITAASTDDVQPVRLSVVVEPRLEGKSWYLAADAALIDGLIFANLAGTNGPELIPREGFDIDGMELKARIDFGCAFADWRGWFKNQGPA